VNVDTGQFRAIVAERDQLRSELPLMRGQIARLAESVEEFTYAMTAPRYPAAHAMARRGQARHARPSSWQPKIVQGGRK
jgi:hypothetical protein